MFKQVGETMLRRKFLQIYSQLKQRIESGEYPVGQLLPSENTLIGEFDCSRNTVRRAISELVRDGYVQTRQGWGVCNIFQPIEHSSYTIGMIEPFRETARRTGKTSTTRVVAFDTCMADQAIAAQTGFPVGEELFALQRIHDLDGVARILNISYLRRSCMPGLTREIAEGSLYCYLEEELGMSIITSKRTFTVELATPQDRHGTWASIIAWQWWQTRCITARALCLSIPNPGIIPAASAFRITRYAARRNPDHDKRRCHFRHRLL